MTTNVYSQHRINQQEPHIGKVRYDEPRHCITAPVNDDMAEEYNPLTLQPENEEGVSRETTNWPWVNNEPPTIKHESLN